MDLSSVQVEISPNHPPIFQVNWQVLFKCNLDCSYCTEHDNSVTPMSYEKCVDTVEFILQYVDIILDQKPKYEKKATLTLIGGEPFAHPEIYNILKLIKKKHNEYQDKWNLDTCVTTNGLFGNNLLKKSIGLIDQWTLSYHTETTPKQKQLILKNINTLIDHKQQLQVKVMAPADDNKFNEAKHVHDTLKKQNIDALMKPIHYDDYKIQQAGYFRSNWLSSYEDNQSENYNTKKGVTCCNQVPLIFNNDKKNKSKFIDNNNFKDWYCGLNWSFLYVNHKRQVFNNMGCAVSHFSSKSEPIGNIDNYKKILDTVKKHISNNTMPVIKCPKSICKGCGMCAPKAKTKEDFVRIMKYRLVDTDILDFDN